jgi:hypothetical protein
LGAAVRPPLASLDEVLEALFGALLSGKGVPAMNQLDVQELTGDWEGY